MFLQGEQQSNVVKCTYSRDIRPVLNYNPKTNNNANS